MDDRDGVIWLNGKLVPWRDAKVHVLFTASTTATASSRRYASTNGKTFKLTEHSTRLRKSASMLNYELPYSVAELDAATKLVVSENKLDSGYVRPVAWRGSEVIGMSAIGTKVHVAITGFPWGAYYEQKAIKIVTSRWKRPSPARSARRKQGSPALTPSAPSPKMAYRCRIPSDALMHDYKRAAFRKRLARTCSWSSTASCARRQPKCSSTAS